MKARPGDAHQDRNLAGPIPTGPILQAGRQALRRLAEGGIGGTDLTDLQALLTRAEELSAALSAQVIRNARLTAENHRLRNPRPAIRELTLQELDDLPPGAIVHDIAGIRWAKSSADEHDCAEGIRRQMCHNAAGREVGATRLLGDCGPVTAL